MSLVLRMAVAFTSVSGRMGGHAFGGLGSTITTTTTTMPLGAGNG